MLITGASGLIGTHLTNHLLAEGYDVAHMGRLKSRSSRVERFVWDVEGGVVERGWLDGVDAIIHLSGAGIGDQRWTPARKEEIIMSRVRTSRLLFQQLARTPHKVHTFISISAIGLYGLGSPGVVFAEQTPPGDDFLARVVGEWEMEVDHISTLGIRVVKLRAGIVFSPSGGALEKMLVPVRWFVGAYLGSGRQVISWVHIGDLCAGFRFALEHHISGAYNVTALEPVTNKELTDAIARRLGRKLLLPPVPPFVLRIVLGEVARYALHGNPVSSAKLRDAGFIFQFDKLDEALTHLLD